MTQWEIVLAARFSHPSFANPKNQATKQPERSGRSRFVYETLLIDSPPAINKGERNAGRRIVLMPAHKRRAGRATEKSGLRRPPLAGALACRHSTYGFRQEDFRPQGSASGQASRRRRQSADIAANAILSHSDAPRAPVLVLAGIMPEPPGNRLYLSVRGRRTRSAVREYPPGWRPLKSVVAAFIVVVSGKSKALEFRSMNQRISRNTVSRECAALR
jgi:hypothetical protein